MCQWKDVNSSNLVITKILNYFRNIKVHPDGHIAAIGGHDGVVRIWNILSNSQAAEIKAHNVRIIIQILANIILGRY